jgi:hypothetical protein
MLKIGGVPRFGYKLKIPQILTWTAGTVNNYSSTFTMLVQFHELNNYIDDNAFGFGSIVHISI